MQPRPINPNIKIFKHNLQLDSTSSAIRHKDNTFTSKYDYSVAATTRSKEDNLLFGINLQTTTTVGHNMVKGILCRQQCVHYVTSSSIRRLEHKLIYA